MGFRMRLAIGAVLALAFLGVAGHVADGDAAPGSHATHAVVSASASTHAIAAVVRAPRVLRSVPDAVAPSTGFALAAGLLAVGVCLRRARRITDVGGDWRSLLLGAPPASTC
jgi:hypothetical protein